MFHHRWLQVCMPHSCVLCRLTSRSIDPTALVSTRPNTPTRSPSPAAAIGSNTTVTPSQVPKDLSGIFAPLPQFTPHSFPSPGKSITKRMLVRSRTEPSPTSPSSSQSSPCSAIAPTLSLPTVISASQKISQRLPSPPSPSPSPSPSIAIAKPHLRTYSQSRSFLVALPADIASRELSSTGSQIHDVNNPILEPDDGVRESYTDLRTRWGVDHSEVRLDIHSIVICNLSIEHYRTIPFTFQV
jgi:hypothetical protein